MICGCWRLVIFQFFGSRCVEAVVRMCCLVMTILLMAAVALALVMGLVGGFGGAILLAVVVIGLGLLLQSLSRRKRARLLEDDEIEQEIAEWWRRNQWRR